MNLSKEATLEEVAERFANWRRDKKPGERISHELWQRVRQISDNYRISQITKALRINTEQYRRYVRMDLKPTTNEVPRIKQPSVQKNFVKIENNLSTQPSDTLRLEFIRKDGTQLNCYYPNLEILHQTVQWFVRS